MEITESALTTQYQRANSAWPFIHQTELARGLPRMLLFAVGSRETNLTNEVGDFGNVPLQCAIAATMLQGMLAITGGNVEEAAAIYNSGQRGEFGTTHHNYGIDVRQRMQVLQRKFGNGSRVQPGTPAWFHRDLSLASPFMKGSDVTVVQKKTGAAPDGVFGPVTQTHVVNFQSHHGLTADGIVGPQTARVLGP